MPKKSTLDKTFESALKAYKDSASSSHKKIHKALTELQARNKELDEAVARRAAARKSEDDAFEKKVVGEGEKALARHRKQKPADDPDGLADDQMRFYDNVTQFIELQIAGEKNQVAARRSATAVQDGSDQKMVDMYHHFSQLSVEALKDDAALDNAIAVISGGTILSGFSAIDMIVLGGALTAAALLAREIYKNGQKERAQRADKDAAREAAALALINEMQRLGSVWVKIFK